MCKPKLIILVIHSGIQHVYVLRLVQLVVGDADGLKPTSRFQSLWVGKVSSAIGQGSYSGTATPTKLSNQLTDCIIINLRTFVALCTRLWIVVYNTLEKLCCSRAGLKNQWTKPSMRSVGRMLYIHTEPPLLLSKSVPSCTKLPWRFSFFVFFFSS